METTPLTPPSNDLPGWEQLREVVAKLRGPGGCPWDHEQTHGSLRGGLLEEAYEVVAAIDAADDANLREELGDLLLQVVFHSQIADEEGRFNADEVAREVSAKLVRRHPHVFGGENLANSQAVLVRWEEIKRAEKGADHTASVLDGIPAGLPSLLHAEKVQKKAGKVGFDWDAAAPILEKVREELAEVEAAMEAGEHARIEEEIGDLLFAVVNLSRKLKVEAEVALRGATEKFVRRFRRMETLARERGLEMKGMSLAALDEIWDEVKRDGAA
jgi:MazG family protein